MNDRLSPICDKKQSRRDKGNRFKSTLDQKKKQLCFAILTVTLATAASLLIFELALRLFPPAWLKYRMDFISLDPRGAVFGSDASWKVKTKNGQFWRFEPNAEFSISSSEFNNLAHIDELGGRIVVQRNEGTKATVLLPFIGDSFTFGVGVPDEDTFSSLLSSIFSDLRILNLGVPGTALDSQLRIVALRHEELGRPRRYVFFFFMGNDFFDLLKEHPIDSHGLNFDSKQNTDYRNNILSDVNDFVIHDNFLKNVYTIQFIRAPILHFINRIRGHFNSYVDTIFPIMNAADGEYYLRAQAALVSQLDTLAHMQEELEFRSLIVAIPDRHQINTQLRKMDAAKYGYDEYSLEPLRPNTLLKNAVLSAGIGFLDATECLGIAVERNALYYRIDDHFTSAGHKRFADCIAVGLRAFLYR